jgi:hypothetical protein
MIKKCVIARIKEFWLDKKKKNYFVTTNYLLLITFNTCHVLYYRIILDHGPQCFENQKQEPTTSA